jgi:hypothetical protein
MRVFKSMKGPAGKGPAIFLVAMTVAPVAFAGCVGITTTARPPDAHLIWSAAAVRACTLVLTGDTDADEWWQCVEAVGDQHPSDTVLLGCADSITWHSQTDGRMAGLKIGACFRKGAVKAAQGRSPPQAGAGSMPSIRR